MFIVTWLFDKLGYMPKVTVDTSWPFPISPKDLGSCSEDKPAVKKAAPRKAKVPAKTTKVKKTK